LVSMDNILERLQYLLGKNPLEVREALSQSGYSFKFIFTRDPKAREERVTEKVLRIRQGETGLEVLVGYFKDADL
jgi:hypothetical protein